MKEKIKTVLLTILRYTPLILCLGFAAWYLLNGDNISVATILDRVPSTPWRAAVFMIILYAAKSLSVVFPIIVLHIAGGFLFPPVIAVIVNVLGTIVELTVPYWVGRISGTAYANRLMEKHPKIADVISKIDSKSFSMSFFLRIISCLPSDAVSMYLGATKMSFKSYLSGSFLGTLPSILTATLLGTSVTDPTSPMFWISLSLTVGISVFSFLFYLVWQKKKSSYQNGGNSQ